MAGQQYGHVTLKQPLELGLPKRTISYHITTPGARDGSAGVYALGHIERSALAHVELTTLEYGHPFSPLSIYTAKEPLMRR